MSKEKPRQLSSEEKAREREDINKLRNATKVERGGVHGDSWEERVPDKEAHQKALARERRLEAPEMIELLEKEIEEVTQQRHMLQGEIVELGGSRLEEDAPAPKASKAPASWDIEQARNNLEDARRRLEFTRKRKSVWEKIAGSKKEKKIEKEVEQLESSLKSMELASGGEEWERVKRHSSGRNLERLRTELDHIDTRLEDLQRRKKTQEAYLKGY